MCFYGCWDLSWTTHTHAVILLLSTRGLCGAAKQEGPCAAAHEATTTKIKKITDQTHLVDRCRPQQKGTWILQCVRATFDVKRLQPWVRTACCVVALTALPL